MAPLLPRVTGMQLEIRTIWALPPMAATQWPVGFGVAMRLNADQTQRTDCGVTFFSPRNASLTTLISNTGAIVDTPHDEAHSLVLPIKPRETNVTLHCFIDHSVLEAYGANGRAAITARTYPLDDALGVGLWAEGSNARRCSAARACTHPTVDFGVFWGRIFRK